MQGFLNLGDSFDSCITATWTFFLPSTTLSSMILFLIPLICRTFNVLSSLICSVGGAGDICGVGGGDCWDGGAEQVSQVSSLAVPHLRVRNISHTPTQSICCTCGSLLDL